MRSNFTNPAGFLTAEQREALRNALLTGIVRPIPPGTLPPQPVPPRENFRTYIEEIAANLPLQRSQSQSRSPNDQEATALIFTFGDTVGKFLIDIIKIRPGTGETDDKTQVLLPENYKSEELAWLEIFIYKATRVWQQKVGLYHHRKGRSNYNYKQLYRLETLNSEQHAAAVRDWFYANYGNEYRLIGSGPLRRTPREFWSRILKVLGLNQPEHPWNVDAMQQIVNNLYGCVIKEIRDASKFHRLGQNWPNPF